MSSSINIPTIIPTSFEPLAYGLERLINAQPLPEGCQDALDPTNRRTLVSKGHSTLSLPVERVKQLREKLHPQAISALFRLLPKLLSSCFLAARTDYTNELLKEGMFALTSIDEESHKLRSLRRLCRLCGMDPDGNQVHQVLRGFVLLTELRLETVINGTARTIDGLIKCPKGLARYIRGHQIDDGEHRGGKWAIAQINPELFSLAFHRFAQLPSDAIKVLPPRDFNTYLACLGQSACKQRGEFEVLEKRLIHDAGHAQTSTRGTEREQGILRKSLNRLIEAGYLISYVIDKAHKVLLELAPQTLLQIEPESPNPAAPPPLGPENLLQGVLDPKVIQAVKAHLLALVRTLEKGSSTAPPPNPSEGAGLDGVRIRPGWV